VGLKCAVWSRMHTTRLSPTRLTAISISPAPREKIPRLVNILGAVSLLFLCLCLAQSAGAAANLF